MEVDYRIQTAKVGRGPREWQDCPDIKPFPTFAEADAHRLSLGRQSLTAFRVVKVTIEGVVE